MKKINFKTAYTLAEVVLAMVIVGMVVLITMNITRSKIEKVQKYHYYTAYTTLTSLVSEILADIDNGILPTDICSEFESRLNLYPGDITVDGEEVTPSCDLAQDTTDNNFSKSKPNIVTRNDMRFYNLSTGAGFLSILSDTEVENEDTGFIVYIDIDGEKNFSYLFEDVFPFYVTLTGKVIPGYPTDSSADPAGGNSIASMACSVRYETVDDDSVLDAHWLVKSVSFQEAACTSGYVISEDYCGDYDIADECTEDDAECVLVPLKPVKYLVR